MSQAMQKNDDLVMIRDITFISKAENLLPTIHQTIIKAQDIITLVNDPKAVHGWSAKVISPATVYFNQSFQTGESFIIDFGQHGVGYLSFLF
ncbi:hypothetical protein [Gilliamella apicola]|uniref:hypothetical protein n=1 Tax=Gilliamella apicola TaxID=1196095 RepID=UPI002FEE288C